MSAPLVQPYGEVRLQHLAPRLPSRGCPCSYRDNLPVPPASCPTLLNYDRWTAHHRIHLQSMHLRRLIRLCQLPPSNPPQTFNFPQTYNLPQASHLPQTPQFRRFSPWSHRKDSNRTQSRFLPRTTGDSVRHHLYHRPSCRPTAATSGLFLSPLAFCRLRHRSLPFCSLLPSFTKASELVSELLGLGRRKFASFLSCLLNISTQRSSIWLNERCSALCLYRRIWFLHQGHVHYL